LLMIVFQYGEVLDASSFGVAAPWAPSTITIDEFRTGSVFAIARNSVNSSSAVDSPMPNRTNLPLGLGLPLASRGPMPAAMSTPSASCDEGRTLLPLGYRPPCEP